MVRIRGVITSEVPAPDFVVQDESGGIYVLGSHNPAFPHHLGEIVDIEGKTQAGGFAPVIVETSSHLVGNGVLPRATVHTFKELAGGQFDSQWMKIRGIVQSAYIDRTSWREPTVNMRVASGEGDFLVRIPIFTDRPDLRSWVGSAIVLEGVCGSLSNGERQLVGLIFYVPRLSFIKIEDDSNKVPVSELLRFSPTRPADERISVQGVVTYQVPGEAIFLQSENVGLRVLTKQQDQLLIGDVVKAIGFPTMGESEPALKEAVFQRIGHQNPPSPVDLKIGIFFERYDGVLVSSKAKLLGIYPSGDHVNLSLEQDGFAFSANVATANLPAKLRSLPSGSTLRVTGICLVRAGGLWRTPESFQVLIRSAQDVEVLRVPPWWSGRHLLWLVGILSGILLFAFFWVATLRGRLHKQMELYRQKARGSAVLEERNRIARELHDTLEQDLAGIILQLDLALSCFEHPSSVAKHALVTARKMSAFGLLEARRSVWDLRSHLLENGDLGQALVQVIDLLRQRSDVTIQFKVSGEPTRIGVKSELNLLRIGQEAMTNALKHAEASQVTVTLKYDDDQICLSICDDGKGFGTTDLTQTAHFGLLDMRERARALASDLVITSEVGAGTCIGLTVERKETELQ